MDAASAARRHALPARLAAAALQREQALDAAGQPVRARSRRRADPPAGVVEQRARQPTRARRGGRALIAQPALVAHGLPQRVGGAQALDVPGRVAQAAVLVEIALRELDGAVVVCVPDGGARMEHLRPACLEHRAAEGLVLGVLHVREPDLRPALARVAGVHVRQERQAAPPVHDRPAVRREAREELGQLARDHRARAAREGEVRPERRAHPLVEPERLAVGLEPAVLRHGVLREEADQVSAGALGAEVARAPVAEVLGRDLDQLGAGRACYLAGAVARPRVDDDQLDVALGPYRGEHLLEALVAVLHRDNDGDRAGHFSGAASSGPAIRGRRTGPARTARGRPGCA